MSPEASVISSPNAMPYVGLVETTVQALRLAYAAHQGIIPRIVRRLNDSERREMIKSGAVFVFSVDESQIRRWTDSRLWSPSRIVGNFLVYREVYERVGTRQTRTGSSASPVDRSNGRQGSWTNDQDEYGAGYSNGSETAHDAVKPDGLLKKTITVTIGPSDLHVVSYYTQNDIKNQTLPRLSSRSDIMNLELDPSVFKFSAFRNPPKVEQRNGVQMIICEPEDNNPLSNPDSARQRQHRGSNSMGGGYDSASDRGEMSPRSANRTRFPATPILEQALQPSPSATGSRWRSPSDVTHPSSANSHGAVSPSGWPAPSRTRSSDEYYQPGNTNVMINQSAPLSSNSSSSSSSPPWNSTSSPPPTWSTTGQQSTAPGSARYGYAAPIYPQPSGTYYSQHRQPRAQASYSSDQSTTENGSHYTMDGVEYTSSPSSGHDGRQWEQTRQLSNNQHVQLPAINTVAEPHFSQSSNSANRYQRSPEVYF